MSGAEAWSQPRLLCGLEAVVAPHAGGANRQTVGVGGDETLHGSVHHPRNLQPGSDARQGGPAASAKEQRGRRNGTGDRREGTRGRRKWTGGRREGLRDRRKGTRGRWKGTRDRSRRKKKWRSGDDAELYAADDHRSDSTRGTARFHALLDSMHCSIP